MFFFGSLFSTATPFPSQTSDKICHPFLPYPAHPFPINPHTLTRESVIGVVSYFTWFRLDKTRLLLFAVASHIELQTGAREDEVADIVARTEGRVGGRPDRILLKCNSRALWVGMVTGMPCLFACQQSTGYHAIGCYKARVSRVRFCLAWPEREVKEGRCRVSAGYRQVAKLECLLCLCWILDNRGFAHRDLGAG